MEAGAVTTARLSSIILSVMLRTTDKILFILSRFRTGQSLGPAAIASVRVAEREGRDGEVVSLHTLMYRLGSEGRNGEER